MTGPTGGSPAGPPVIWSDTAAHFVTQPASGVGERTHLGMLVCKACVGQRPCDLADRVGVGTQHALALLLRFARENLVEDEAVAIVVSPIRASTARRIDHERAGRRAAELKARHWQSLLREVRTPRSLRVLPTGGYPGGSREDRGTDGLNAMTRRGRREGGLAFSERATGPGGGHGVRCCSALRMPRPFLRAPAHPLAPATWTGLPGEI